MQSIESIPGKLLYFVHELGANKKISQSQKSTLKDLILSHNLEVMNAYQSYLHDGTELTLQLHLLQVARREKEKQVEQATSQSSRKIKREISIKVPKRNIQKLTGFANRI